jgi:xanthine dehydrogenase YagS FAD-binding subunit
MNPFSYSRAATVREAIGRVASDPDAAFLGGGTSEIDLMKEDVHHRSQLVDVTALPSAQIETLPGQGVRIGALARNSDVAYHPLIREQYPVLSEALLAGASAQLRNMATVGGNLLQRTRCYYFRDTAMPCNKREPGSGCSAIDGFNRVHAIFGASPQCIATHPSDMCVALVALDAVVQVEGPRGARQIPIGDFHRLPGDRPDIDTTLQHGELITAVDLPAAPFARRSHYLKVRDRASFAFALVSAAVALDIDGGTIRTARVVMGGVAHKPWRSMEAERVLVGAPATDATFTAAATAAMQGAQPRKFNAYKVTLGRNTIARALTELMSVA